ncbi:MAG: YjgP/YjgQ family permease [Candidatus Latescibacteria bacterium]|nr:YjgP/YjgQ family permease [Candidatus Latescibacterota bacterium]
MVLSRYVLKEHVTPFVFGFAVIIFLLIVDLILETLDKVLGKGIPVPIVLELFFLNLAWMVALAVPMAVLVSTLMAFGRLSADGEIIAMRALGVSIFQVVRPVFVAGAILALVMLWFNDRVLPEFNHRARLLIMDIHRKRPSVAFTDMAGIVIDDFPGYRIVFDRVDPGGRMMQSVKVYHFEGDPYPTTILADSGQVVLDPGEDRAYLSLLGGSLLRFDEKEPTVQVETVFEWAQLKLGDAGEQMSRSSSTYRNDREMGVGMMQARIEKNKEEIGTSLTDLSHRSADLFEHLLLQNVFEDTDVSVFRALIGRMQANMRVVAHKSREVQRLEVEVHKKFSIPAACIAFVLVGVPLGIQVRGRSPAIGASLSIGFFLMW